ncbi:hypothetical protein NX059_009599 [Plenodomus lindquistii]|nr:hypothetical protein NX059_009599 [Plenodomus lindquistii]
MTSSTPRPHPPPHDDADILTAKSFPYLELYGQNWSPQLFNPLYRNIRTGATFSSAHHAHGNSPRTRAIFELSSSKASYGFCLKWVSVPRPDGSTARMRCGECFLDKGPNSVFQKNSSTENVSSGRFFEILEPIVREEPAVNVKTIIQSEAADMVLAELMVEMERRGFVDPELVAGFYAGQAHAFKVAKQKIRETQKARAMESKSVAAEKKKEEAMFARMSKATNATKRNLTKKK